MENKSIMNNFCLYKNKLPTYNEQAMKRTGAGMAPSEPGDGESPAETA